MIYKFKDLDAIMEVELIDDENRVNFMIETEDFKTMINLEQKDVFRLIGALHLIHKDMSNE